MLKCYQLAAFHLYPETSLKQAYNSTMHACSSLVGREGTYHRLTSITCPLINNFHMLKCFAAPLLVLVALCVYNKVCQQSAKDITRRVAITRLLLALPRKLPSAYSQVDPYATENEAVPSQNEAFRWMAKNSNNQISTFQITCQC